MRKCDLARLEALLVDDMFLRGQHQPDGDLVGRLIIVSVGKKGRLFGGFCVGGLIGLDLAEKRGCRRTDCKTAADLSEEEPSK